MLAVMPPLPPLVRFMLLHGAIGFGISALFVALLLGTDAGGLATLLRGAESHPLPALLLWFFCGPTFGSVQIAAAVMLHGRDDDYEPRGGTRIPVHLPAGAMIPWGRARGGVDRAAL